MGLNDVGVRAAVNYEAMSGRDIAIEIAKRQGWVCEPHASIPGVHFVRAPWERRGRDYTATSVEDAWKFAAIPDIWQGPPHLPRPDNDGRDCLGLLTEVGRRGWTFDIRSDIDGDGKWRVTCSVSDGFNHWDAVAKGGDEAAFRRAVCIAFLRACDAQKGGEA